MFTLFLYESENKISLIVNISDKCSVSARQERVAGVLLLPLRRRIRLMVLSLLMQTILNQDD